MVQSRTKLLLNAAFAALALAGLGIWMTPESSAQSSAGKGTFETDPKSTGLRWKAILKGTRPTATS